VINSSDVFIGEELRCYDEVVEEEIIRRLTEQEKKLDAIYKSTERTRKYILWTVIASVVVFVLPIIGLIFAIPTFLSSYSAYTNLLK
jgi:hypothetical protein